MTAIKRRQLIKAGGAIAGLAVFGIGWRQLPRLFGQSSVISSSATDASGQHYLVTYHIELERLTKIPIPMRAHASLYNQARGEVIFFARRPGDRLYIVSAKQGEMLQEVRADAGRHFFGHGVLSQDEKYLITTENDYERGQGLVVVRSVSENYKVVAEWNSGGIGPHECVLLSDGETLAVANGGILTHPEKPREKLNLDSMQSNLAYLSWRTGEIDSYHTLPFDKLSIRHLCVDKNDRIGIAMQYEGDQYDNVPLVAFHDPGENIRYKTLPMESQRRFTQYTASIQISEKSGIACVTAPRGNLVSFWNPDTAELLSTSTVRDGAGLCLMQTSSSNAEEYFIITSGQGRCYFYNSKTFAANKFMDKQYQGLKWDNHLNLFYDS